MARTELLDQSGNTLLKFDLVENITEENSAKVTMFPVESGTDITDNISVQNTKFTLTGLFSEATTKELGADELSVSSARSLLITLARSKVKFKLKEGGRVHDNIVIERLSTKRDSSTHKGFIFTLSLVKIRTVKTRFGGIVSSDGVAKDPSEETEKAAAGTSEGGNKSTTEDEQSYSILAETVGVYKDVLDATVGRFVILPASKTAAYLRGIF